MEKGIKNIAALCKSAYRRDDGGMEPFHHLQLCPYPSPVCASGFGDSETDAEYEVEYTHPRVPPPILPSTMVPITTPPASLMSSSGSSGYVPAPIYMQHHRRPSYQPISMPQPMVPSHGLLMGPMHMHPISQGRHMSIHSVLSPSPPGDEEEEE